MQDEINNNHAQQTSPETSEQGNNPLSPNSQTQQHYQQTNSYEHSAYHPAYCVRPKIPGRGFGIASMILGISGISGCLLTVITLLSINAGVIDSIIGKGLASLICAIFVFDSLLYAVLAYIFSVISRKRGYRNGISMSGLILSVVSFVFLLSTIGIVIRGSVGYAPPYFLF